MKRTKKLGIVVASGALALGAVVSAPSAIAAISGTDAKVTVAPVGVTGIVTGEPVTVEPGANGIATVTCNKKVKGGGGTTSGFDIFFTDSFPSAAKIWTVRGTNTGDTAQTLTAWAVC